MSYDYAQTFYIDSSAVKGSPQVNISAVELYFKKKPNVGTAKDPNKSGIVQPGVTLLFCTTNMNGTPNLDDIKETARLEYNQIVATGDASDPSKFVFDKEVYCDTNKQYSIVARFDGYEDFELWTNKKGNYFLGTNVISPGVTDKYVGNLYISQNRSTANSSAADAGGQGQVNGTGGTAGNGSWIPKSDEDLKFTVFVARYRSTNSVINSTSNSIVSNTVLIPQSTSEFILFDRKRSQKNHKAKTGELIFQRAPLVTNASTTALATANVVKGNVSITATGVNFNTLYSGGTNNYIVLVGRNQDPGHHSGFNDLYNVRKVLSVDSNSSITVDRPPSFTNSVSNFMVTVVGEVDFLDKSKAFDNRPIIDSWHFGKRVRQDFLVLRNSSANLSHRFVNNTIDSINIVAGGSGYNNTDYIVITSNSAVGVANVMAYANLTTNSSGGIVNTFVTNTGFGMVRTPTFRIANSTGANSTGTSANFTFNEGPYLISEVGKFRVTDAEIINYEIDSITPQLNINNPSGTSYYLKHQLAYYLAANGTYVVNQNASANKKLIKNLRRNGLPYSNTPVVMSRSNEVVLLSTQSGNSTVVEIITSSNNDFIDTCVDEAVITYNKTIINNDYTGEHTSFGNAAAKHVSKKIAFENGRLAEDLLVYIRAYRPAPTDLKVYARMHNSSDPEAFDDKDWTLLTCVNGADQFSSATNDKDIREFTYNLPQFPNTQFTSTGTVTLSSGSPTVVGVGTAFRSEIGGFAANDLVKIYNPLFPQNHFITSVASVASNTSLTLDDSTTNVSVLGSGLKIDKLRYPQQGFRNIQNDNVFRYFNTSLHAYDGFDTFAIKVIMLSPNNAVVPEIEDIRAIGVSA